MGALLQNRKIGAATHNIMAYRIDVGNGVWAQDHDEDGESAAGGRLLHLLQMINATDVVVVCHTKEPSLLPKILVEIAFWS